MKFTIDQSTFSAKLNLVSRAIPSRPSHPILANILLVADAATQKITLSAFDLSLGIQLSTTATVERGGTIALPAKLLTDMVGHMAEGVLTLEGGTVEENYQVEIKSATGKFKLHGQEATEYPELPSLDDGTTVSLSAAALLEGLRSTLFSTSSDETKQVLTGIRITETTDGLEFASTDGHRLTVFRSFSETSDALSEGAATELAVTVPTKALQELVKMLERSPESITVSYDASQIIFEWADHRLTSRLLEGQYPNYNQLIPKAFTRQITIDRRLFLSALDRIAVLADQKNNICKLSFDTDAQTIALSVDAQDVGSGNETIAAQLTGDDLTVAFNVKYLIDGLKAMATAEVSMQLNTATSPAIVSPLGGQKMTYLIMPVSCRL